MLVIKEVRVRTDFSDLPYLKEERKSFFQLKTQNVIKITSRQKILSNGVGEVVT